MAREIEPIYLRMCELSAEPNHNFPKDILTHLATLLWSLYWQFALS